MPTGQDDTARRTRWATLGVIELGKELEHLRRAMPGSATIPDLERYLGDRRAAAERYYGGVRLEAR